MRSPKGCTSCVAPVGCQSDATICPSSIRGVKRRPRRPAFGDTRIAVVDAAGPIGGGLGLDANFIGGRTDPVAIDEDGTDVMRPGACEEPPGATRRSLGCHFWPIPPRPCWTAPTGSGRRWPSTVCPQQPRPAQCFGSRAESHSHIEEISDCPTDGLHDR
jgi:hypothetical protein